MLGTMGPNPEEGQGRTRSYLRLWALGLAFLVLSLFLGLGIGAADVSRTDILEALTFWRVGDEPSLSVGIVRQIRLPRVLGSLFVGGSLAVVGAALQAVMRNELADPYILGISSGASVGAALSSALGATVLGPWTMPFFAFGAALLSMMVVVRVASVRGRMPPVRLLLAGVAMSAFGTALTGFLLYVTPEATAVRGMLFWLMGGLGSADWSSLGWTIGLAGCPLIFLVVSVRWQNLLLLGDETALSLGLDVVYARKCLVGVSALLTGTLVAFAGPIGFVGLIVPHALRPMTGPDHRRLVPVAWCYGAAMLGLMDTVARVAMAPQELPVGLLMGMLGAPFFLVVLRKFGQVQDGG